MPLVGSALAAAIKSAISAIPEANRDYDTVWNTVADAIVTYITTNAVVTVASVSGVTVGAGVSGPGTGTIS